jgi:hypothetical protein
MTKKAGIQAMTSYILGLPGENPDTVKQTMKFASRLSPLYGFHILAPFPGTEVRVDCDAYGLEVMTDDWDRYDANQSVARCRDIAPEEVDRQVNEFFGGITSYVDSAVKRYDAGELLSEKDRAMVESVKSGIFIRDIIFNEAVESFPGVPADRQDSLFDELVAHVTNGSGSNDRFVRAELDRLVAIGCIRAENGGGRATYRWA